MQRRPPRLSRAVAAASPPPPGHCGPERVPCLILTVLLTVLALAGNLLHLPLCFGVDILFGSVAALLALVWLGTWPGLLVALTGSLYTWFLWGHPWAVLILTAETGAVAWQQTWARRRGREPLPLAVAVTLYWCLPGIPLVLVCYHLGLGMGWTPTLLIAAKQALNGVLNAGLAGLVLLAVAAWRGRATALPVARVLFSVLLSALLLPAVLTIAWEGRYLKDRLETEQAERCLQETLAGLLWVLLGVAGAGVALAEFLSRQRVRPLTALVEVTEALPAAIREDRPWPVPRPGLLREPGRLAEAAAGMASSLAAGFRALREEQEAQARQRALADLQAQVLGWLVTESLDEAAFAQRLCRHLGSLLPGHRCTLVHPGPEGTLEVLAAPGLTAGELAGLNALLARPRGVCCYAQVMATGAPAAIPDMADDPRCADLPAPVRAALRAGFAVPVVGPGQRVLGVLGVLALGSQVAGAPAPATREVLETAATLAGLALDSIRLRQHHAVLLEALSQAGTGIIMARRSGDDFLVSYATLANFLRRIHPADRALVTEQLRAVRAGEPLPDAQDVRVCRPDGEERVVHYRTRTHLAPDGRVTAVEGVSTRERRTEDALRAQQERYRMVLENLEDLLVRVDVAGRFEFVSPSYCRTFGRSESELLGQTYMPLVHPDDQAATASAVASLFSPPHTCNVEQRAQTVAGWRWFQWFDRALLDDQGQVVGIVALGRDITARKEAEQALAAKRRRLSNIISATRVGTWEWEVQTGAAVINERWAEIIGYRLADLEPISFQTWVDHTHPHDLAVSQARAEAHFRGETESYECEARMRHRDGHWVWILDQGRVMERDTAGRPLLMSGIHQDITARKEAELALAERESMLGELLTLAAQFVAVSDHGLDALTAGALERIGRFARADRSYLFRLDESAGTLNNTREWVAEGVTPAITQSLAIPLADLPELMIRLHLGEPVVVARVTDLPADWSREQSLFRSQDIRSIMVAPLVVREELLGCVGFDAVAAPRDWSAVEVRFLQVFASILAGAIDRARATAELRASNTRYEALARQSRSMSWEIDPAGRYTYVSPVCEQVLGYRARELTGLYLSDLVPAAAQEAVGATLRAVMARREPLRDFDRPCQGMDGWGVWLMTNGAPFFAPDGTYLGYRGIDTDITDRHLAQDLVRESEARLSAVFENAPIGMALVGPDQRLTLVNRALAAFLGRAPEDLVGLSFEAVGHPHAAEQDAGAVAALRVGREPYRVTRHYQRPDGRVVWGDLRVSLLPTRPGAAPLPLAMVEDVTELHAATERQRALEAALTRYAGLLEDLVDLINRPLAPADKDCALLDLGCRTLGTEAAVLGLVTDGHEQRVLVAVPGDGVTAPALLAAVLAEALAQRGSPCVLTAERLPGAGLGGAPRSCLGLAFDAPRPDGPTETLCLSLWGSSPSLDLGDPERQMIRLIAQRLAAVRYQEQIHRDLVESRERETIGHLASGVAHDFNNLLGVIDANIYFLGLGLPGADSDPELRQVLAETQSALGQAKVITSGMLSLSRAGGVPLETVDLGEAVAELVQILRQVLPPGIVLGVAIPAGLKARTNAGFLQAALLNLALNARDAMPQGGSLRISAAAGHWSGETPLAIGHLPPGDGVDLRVSDTGSGIDPAIIGHIFDPLFSTKAKQRGHGLGLFMVQEFVVRSGAGLMVESHPGRGTRFRLLLPLAAAPPPSAPALTPGELPPGLRVLVVDDDPRVREAVARLLTLAGARLVQAEHGRAALAALDGDPDFDLVLSDVAMPGLDGVGLYCRLARERPGLPVILMTGQNEAPAAVPDLFERPLVLRKPIDPQALRAAVAACVRRGVGVH